VIQFTFAGRGRRYHHLCRFTAAARGFHISGLFRRRYPSSRPGTSPWLGPPAVESWLDLSGAPTCAPDFLHAGAMRAARHGGAHPGRAGRLPGGRVAMVLVLGGVTLALQKA
jgi:hypothetical protein